MSEEQHDHGCSESHVGQSGMHVQWLRDDVAKSMGLETEEDKQRYLAAQRAEGGRAHKAWLKRGLETVKGKPIDGIPRGDWCIEWPFPTREGPETAETIAADLLEVMTNPKYGVPDCRCPYLRHTDYHMTFCDFLEIGSLNSDTRTEYEEAVAHYGSEDDLRKHDTDFLLAQGLRRCESVLKALEGRESA